MAVLLDLRMGIGDRSGQAHGFQDFQVPYIIPDIGDILQVEIVFFQDFGESLLLI